MHGLVQAIGTHPFELVEAFVTTAPHLWPCGGLVDCPRHDTPARAAQTQPTEVLLEYPT